MNTLTRNQKTILAAALAAIIIAALFLSGTALAAELIGKAKAKDIAAAHAGFATSEVTFKKAELDSDDGVAEYEIAFVKGSYRYEYDIDARTGDIREYSQQLTKKARNSSKTQDYIGIGNAKQAALKHAGLEASAVTFTKTKLDKGRTSEYEIEFYTDSMKYDYDIDAVSGSVNEFTHKHVRAKTSPNGGSGNSSSNSAYIGLGRAKEIALKHANLSASEVTFTKAKLDYDDGAAVYEIEFRKGRLDYEYEIDAKTGRILEFDLDD